MNQRSRSFSHSWTTAWVQAAAAILLVSLAGCSGSRPRSVTSTAGASPTSAELPDLPAGEIHQNPPLLPFVNGVGRLAVGLSNVKIGDKHYCLRTYNGSLPGPTILVDHQASPGRQRQLRLDVSNGLQRSCPGSVGSGAPNDECECQGKGCYDFNSTNLHTHGLHVRPDTSPDGRLLSDHVLMRLNYNSAESMRGHGGAPIPEGACAQDRDGFRCSYRFAIDEGSLGNPERPYHEPGTFWYHAHVHGSTAMQLANGMAGALIIRGPVDRIPAIAAAKEQIMVLQQIPFEEATPVEAGTVCDPKNPKHYSVNTFGKVTSAKRNLVNGRLEPYVPMLAGEVQRWRLIEAGITQEVLLALEGPLPLGSCRAGRTSPDRLNLYEIATDGITLTHVRRGTQQLRLDPGYRSDVLVKMPPNARPGTEYCLVDGRGRSLQNEGEEEERNLIAVIPVRGTGADMPLPTDAQLERVAKKPLPCDGSTPVRSTVFFQQKNEQGETCPPLNIDCKLFPDIKFNLDLGATETWKLTSERGPHPYHIHVNPFTVCDEGEGPLKQPYWRDTLLLEGGKKYEIRSHYTHFTGSFVLHCHRLDHEDQGMMGLVEIKRP